MRQKALRQPLWRRCRPRVHLRLRRRLYLDAPRKPAMLEEHHVEALFEQYLRRRGGGLRRQDDPEGYARRLQLFRALATQKYGQNWRVAGRVATAVAAGQDGGEAGRAAFEPQVVNQLEFARRSGAAARPARPASAPVSKGKPPLHGGGSPPSTASGKENGGGSSHLGKEGSPPPPLLEDGRTALWSSPEAEEDLAIFAGLLGELEARPDLAEALGIDESAQDIHSRALTQPWKSNHTTQRYTSGTGNAAAVGRRPARPGSAAPRLQTTTTATATTSSTTTAAATAAVAGRWKGSEAVHEGRTGVVTMDPDCDDEVKLRFPDGVQSGYIATGQLRRQLPRPQSAGPVRQHQHVRTINRANRPQSADQQRAAPSLAAVERQHGTHWAAAAAETVGWQQHDQQRQAAAAAPPPPGSKRSEFEIEKRGFAGSRRAQRRAQRPQSAPVHARGADAGQSRSMGPAERAELRTHQWAVGVLKEETGTLRQFVEEMQEEANRGIAELQRAVAAFAPTASAEAATAAAASQAATTQHLVQQREREQAAQQEALASAERMRHVAENELQRLVTARAARAAATLAVHKAALEDERARNPPGAFQRGQPQKQGGRARERRTAEAVRQGASGNAQQPSHRYRIVALNYVSRLATAAAAAMTEAADKAESIGEAETEAEDGQSIGTFATAGSRSEEPQLAALRPGDVVEALDCGLPGAVEPELLGWLGRLRLLRFAAAVAAFAGSLDCLCVAREEEVAEMCREMRPLEARRFKQAVQTIQGNSVIAEVWPPPEPPADATDNGTDEGQEGEGEGEEEVATAAVAAATAAVAAVVVVVEQQQRCAQEAQEEAQEAQEEEEQQQAGAGAGAAAAVVVVEEEEQDDNDNDVDAVVVVSSDDSSDCSDDSSDDSSDEDVRVARAAAVAAQAAARADQDTRRAAQAPVLGHDQRRQPAAVVAGGGVETTRAAAEATLVELDQRVEASLAVVLGGRVEPPPRDAEDGTRPPPQLPWS
eukprot:SAG22_NODE_1413_length_4476_cov_2.231894_1_plen_997_part_00